MQQGAAEAYPFVCTQVLANAVGWELVMTIIANFFCVFAPRRMSMIWRMPKRCCVLYTHNKNLYASAVRSSNVAELRQLSLLLQFSPCSVSPK